jgi:hypothetical protein
MSAGQHQLDLLQSGRNERWACLRAGGGRPQSGHTGLPFALREAGAVLYVAGAGMLGLAFRITRDHRRKRTRQAAAEEEN